MMRPCPHGWVIDAMTGNEPVPSIALAAASPAVVWWKSR
jgi:hypothetical protein